MGQLIQNLKLLFSPNSANKMKGIKLYFQGWLFSIAGKVICKTTLYVNSSAESS